MKINLHRRASAIIFVLGIVFVASILSVYLIEYSMTELKPRASSSFERGLRTDAYSALNATVAVLEEYYEIDGGLYAPTQGWEFPLADNRINLGRGGEMEVKITDESAKIPLQELTSENLVAIFEEMQFSTSLSQTLADSILDWTDSDDAVRTSGAERDDYEDYSAFPPNRAMKSLVELKYIENVRNVFFDELGEPNDYYKSLAQILSVEDFKKVNLNSASPETLNMLMVIDGKTYDSSLYDAIRGKIGSVEDGIVWVKNVTEITNRGAREVPSKLVACQPQLLKIEITIKRGAGEYYLCAYYGEDQSVSTSSTSQKKNNANTSNGGNNNGGSNSSTKGNASTSSSASGKQSDATSSTNKSTASASKSSNKASKKGGSRKILKVVERGS